MISINDLSDAEIRLVNTLAQLEPDTFLAAPFTEAREGLKSKDLLAFRSESRLTIRLNDAGRALFMEYCQADCTWTNIRSKRCTRRASKECGYCSLVLLPPTRRSSVILPKGHRK